MVAKEQTRELVTGGDPDAVYKVPEVFGDFAPAPDLEYIANYLIPANLRDFPDCNVTYLWKRKGGAGKGKATMGKCIRASGLPAYFSGADYIVWLAADHVKDFRFTAFQVEALLFHELCHVEWEEDDDNREDITLTVKGHDIEAFRAEVDRYGFWASDLQSFAQSVQGRLELK